MAGDAALRVGLIDCEAHCSHGLLAECRVSAGEIGYHTDPQRVCSLDRSCKRCGEHDGACGRGEDMDWFGHYAFSFCARRNGGAM